MPNMTWMEQPSLDQQGANLQHSFRTVYNGEPDTLVSSLKQNQELSHSHTVFRAGSRAGKIVLGRLNGGPRHDLPCRFRVQAMRQMRETLLLSLFNNLMLSSVRLIVPKRLLFQDRKVFLGSLECLLI